MTFETCFEEVEGEVTLCDLAACQLVGRFEFNGPLRQYFSLYRAVSQRKGERGEKGKR